MRVPEGAPKGSTIPKLFIAVKAPVFTTKGPFVAPMSPALGAMMVVSMPAPESVVYSANSMISGYAPAPR